MMLFTRKLHHHITPISSSAPFFLLAGDNFDFLRGKKWKFHAYENRRTIDHVKGLHLTHLHLQTAVLGFQNGLSQPLHFSTMVGKMFAQIQLDNAIEDHRFSDSWKLYEESAQLDGELPKKPILNKLLLSFAGSLDSQWLDKAYGLVERAFDTGKQDLLEKETLIFLSFALAKCCLPVPASTILRKIVETKQYPPVAAWSVIMALILQTPPGALLAAEFILEICYLFEGDKVECDEALISMKPNTVSFNIILAGCLLSGATMKAEQLLGMLPRMRVKVDATSLILMAHVCERNARKEEMKKLQSHIQKAHNLTTSQLGQFFNLLLLCLLKLGDPNSASEVVLKLLDVRTPHAYEIDGLMPCGSTGNWELSYEDFSGDRMFLKLEAVAKQMLDASLEQLEAQPDLIRIEHGVLLPTGKLYVKLIKAFLATGETGNLVELLIKAGKIDSLAPTADDALAEIIHSCVLTGRLDQARSLLDEMGFAGIRAKHCQERGELFTALVQEIEVAAGGVHEWNNVIHYFCKMGLMKDANRAFRRMQSLGHTPDAQTFYLLVGGYAAAGQRNKVKVVWGVMKSAAAEGCMRPDQQLLDLLLGLFVRYAYFEGAVGVVAVMEGESMFVDRYRYRGLMLECHRGLCRGRVPGYMKEPRVRALSAFINWVGLQDYQPKNGWIQTLV